jgi:hypothetical protein
MTSRTELRESVDLENRADLMAAACHFGEASRLMSHANAIRKRAFGPGLGPNELRDLTHEALPRHPKGRSMTNSKQSLSVGDYVFYAPTSR